ncbi:NADP-dependent aldehyde dehydrogenase [Pseudoduganella flava]|uniref:2,5-dioxovalerate dehydrogenase n=1 Tax=Pseudoduganella flava TaxID=871742 RepID=A0A562PZL2_9BURK|nr:aldehyde dehydrogenase (NADP(+)) [Pseudoduganella flava]QGZ38556.1 aldehyde dehydrogenase family protein [Pseudoduganella flava]TWI49882.1 NADP-dependent aldehyde dehydrogenase [Pseudoduganella flava]
MSITGEALIGGLAVKGKGSNFKAWNPNEGKHMEPAFHMVDADQIDAACRLAGEAFDTFRATTDEERATFLETVAAEIMAIGDALIERAMAETGLPRVRLEGERGRTCNQLKLFADLLREGSYRDVRIDSALPERTPPRPDLRYRLIGVGPVAVFAASNFPLAFSVAGGDTASAFAAGCPVVLKAHSAHPGTSELVARAVVKAVQQCGLPAGVFALLTGTGNGIGQTLVAHPAIQAVGFTGSRSGGTALMAVAAARPQPIPVYAEMSSINPVFLLPGALTARGAEIATQFAASLTMGVGQFCTNPGLVLGIAGPEFDAFAHAAAAALGGVAAGTMLTPGIAGSYQAGVATLAQQDCVKTLALAEQQEGKGGPALFVTSGESFLTEKALHGEVFGPASLLVACRDVAEMRKVTEHLEGQLTATLQLEEADLDAAHSLLPVLERKVGRILANGFPTGVEVSTAMVHGGPFPATADGRSTSVGTGAILRFLRPVCYQNLPQPLLPEALRDGNPLAIWRRRDGVLGKD